MVLWAERSCRRFPLSKRELSNLFIPVSVRSNSRDNSDDDKPDIRETLSSKLE
jgi:hypothetical protein